MELAAILVVSLSACTFYSPSNPAPTPGPPMSSTPSPSPVGLVSDADLTSPVERRKKELMDANVIAVCASSTPQAWCRSISRFGGQLGTRVEASSYFVSTDLPSTNSGDTLAMQMCRDIADSTMDREGIPIGVYNVVILNGSRRSLIDCESP